MSISQITLAVYERIAADTTLPTVRIYPNINAATPSGSDVWIAVFMLPAATTKPTLGHGDYYRESGIVQISIYTKAGQGEIKGKLVVDDIRALFPVGLKIGSLEFNQPLSVATGFNDGNGWYQIPVSIPYTQIVI